MKRHDDDAAVCVLMRSKRCPSLVLLGLGSLARLRTLRLRLLGQQDGLDVGQDASLRDRYAAQQLVELLVVADSQLQVTWDDAGLLVVARGVAGQLEDLSAQILQDGPQIDGSAGTHKANNHLNKLSIDYTH